MPLTLRVDGALWRAHLKRTSATYPGLVPVAKGNGYGFTVARLARKAEWLGADIMAVGTYGEVADVIQRFAGQVLVLEPWRPFLDIPASERVIHTVGRAADLAALGERPGRTQIVLEALTSMRRHGFTAAELAEAVHRAHGVSIVGHALHLPLGSNHTDEVETWLAAVPATRLFVSHLTSTQLDELRRRHPATEFCPRVGTELWLGDRSALSARATVLDSHRVRRGERVGYRQRALGRSGHLLVVSGGTAHGIAMEAPAAGTTSRQRATSLAKGGLESLGRTLSPFIVAGRQRWFIEPPHMQVSMVFVPESVRPPDIGDEIEVQVRFTTTHFDVVDIN